ncbi:MAG: HD domain-containing protein [Syntrophobacterales bacterium]|jgi:poly(A) polymerase|nr:HD domain-containing protein [Syntrophobacterales bacterium]
MEYLNTGNAGPSGQPAKTPPPRAIGTLLDNLQQGSRGLASRRSLLTLAELAASRALEVYLVGGSVRELALGGTTPDLDLAVSAQTLELARDLATALGGTYVLLDEAERAARVVRGEEILDLAEFRAPTLKEDLQARDFTLNALAVELKAILGRAPLALIDPCGGLPDLSRGVLRLIAPENFRADPLRLLRAYRFAATHGFQITPETTAAIQSTAPEFPRVAGERVHQELFLLLAAPAAAPVLAAMEAAGLLAQVFPELEDMKGVEQNGFHHLDVFGHSMATVAGLEEVLAAPAAYFGEMAAEVDRYAHTHPKAVLLKLAALFHDAGKPRVRDRRSDPDRYIFYYHEKAGLEIFSQVAARLRCSQAETKTVTMLIQAHMRPFLLLPAFRERELSFRALGRLVRAARPELAGLFALAMADSLAGQGELKPPDSEAVLADLADAAYRFLKERLEPQEQHPKLVNGHDLIRLGLTPGPQFRQLLSAVEEAQWEGLIRTRQQALEMVQRLR